MKNFAFIGDIINPNSKDFQLFDGYFLKKATDAKHIAVIKSVVDNYSSFFLLKINRYQAEKKMKNGKKIKLDNFWIIEYEKNQLEFEIEKALFLSPLNLTIIFDALPNGVMGNNVIASTFYADNTVFNLQEKKIVKKDIEELKRIYALIKSFSENEEQKIKYHFINKALSDIKNLKEIPKQSPFKILAYFSILESLLTTKKRGSNIDASLNHQLKSKITLINNTLDNPINVHLFFKGAESNTLGTIIKKLYEYRNDIAHGNIPDFNNKLKIFKNKRDTIVSFLHEVTRRIILKGIEHPQFIGDIKEC